MSKKDILNELKDQYEVEMNKLREKNHNKVLITSQSGGETKHYVENDFFGCGATWYAIDKKNWRLAKELGFEKGYQEWDFGRKYENGGFGLAQTARDNALDFIKDKYPSELSWLQYIGVGSLID